MRKYDKCEYCKGSVTEKSVTVNYWHKGKLYLFENVPVGVCHKCGERYYPGPIMERLEEIASHKEIFERTMKVPLFNFDKAMVL